MNNLTSHLCTLLDQELVKSYYESAWLLIGILEWIWMEVNVERGIVFEVKWMRMNIERDSVCRLLREVF